MSLLEKTVWMDKSISIYVGELIEYDMREGGFSIIQNEKLLPEAMINKLLSMTKQERHEFIGKLAYNKEFKHIPKLVTEKFKPYRIKFGELNDLKDEDIFYIRKDAICCKRYCYNTKINDFIEFREKKIYNSYMRIEPQYNDDGSNIKPHPIEFYWNATDNSLDISGIKDPHLDLHKYGMVVIITTFMSYLYSMDYDEALRYIVNVMNSYKKGHGYKEGCLHPEQCYRRFDGTAKFRIWQDGAVMEVDDIGEDMIPYCDKAYNYRNILIPLLNLVSK